MGKTIIINERVLESPEIKEVALAASLNKEITRELDSNNTPLSSNPSFPEEFGDSFEKRLTYLRFKQTKDALYNISIIDDNMDVSNLLPRLIETCKRMEEPIRRNLEKIAYNFIIDTFNIPDGVINLKVELTDTLSNTTLNVRVQAEEDDFEYEDIKQKRRLLKDIQKRKVLNGLTSGAALRFAANIKKYVADIYELNPKLPELYRNIIALNEYLLFSVGKIEINDKQKNQLGVSNITLGNDINRTEVNVEAVIFPILIYELIKAFLEVSISHGLPSSKEEAVYIMGKCDYMQAEPWYMRIGPAMYDIFYYMLGDIDDALLPYIFMELSKLPNDLFETAMQEIFAKTKKGRRILQRIKEKHESQEDYKDFSNRMQLANSTVSMISEYCFENDIPVSERKYIFKEAIRQLNEITVRDAREKYYSDIDVKDWMTIITTLQGNRLDILEPETKWALGLYKKNSPRFMEDLYKLHNENGEGYLDVFKRAKIRRMISGQEANLNNYKSIADLGKFIGSLDYERIMGKTKGETSNAVNNAKDNVQIFYEDDEWTILSPKSYEASCYWGNGAEWCTAYRDDDRWYKHYTEQGPLFINIEKNTGKKYQFHFETSSFMDMFDDDMDSPILDNMKANEGVREFWTKYILQNYDYPELYLKFCAERSEYGLNFDLHKIKDEYYFYDTNDETFVELGKLDYCGDWEFIDNSIYGGVYRDYIALIRKYGSYNYINGCGEYISDTWFDTVSSPDYESGYIIFKLKEKYGIINHLGRIELEPECESIEPVYNAYDNVLYYKIVCDGCIQKFNLDGRIEDWSENDDYSEEY